MPPELFVVGVFLGLAVLVVGGVMLSDRARILSHRAADERESLARLDGVQEDTRRLLDAHDNYRLETFGAKEEPKPAPHTLTPLAERSPMLRHALSLTKRCRQ